jgi:hypothetical protein
MQQLAGLHPESGHGAVVLTTWPGEHCPMGKPWHVIAAERSYALSACIGNKKYWT